MKGVDDYWNKYFEYRVIYYYLMALLVAANASDKRKYHEIRERLLKDFPNYRENPHISKILKHNFGKLKAFAISELLTPNYYFAKCMSFAAFHRQ